jgi:hypothetical protein
MGVNAPNYMEDKVYMKWHETSGKDIVEGENLVKSSAKTWR